MDNGLITLRRRCTAGQAGAEIDVAVGVWCGEAIAERLQEGNHLVLLLIRQAEVPNCHVEVVWNFGLRPTGHLLDRPWRAVSGGDVELDRKSVV